jgi:hypothetical protein
MLEKTGVEPIGIIPFDDCVRRADFDGHSPFDGNNCDRLLEKIAPIKARIEKYARTVR